MEAAAGGHRFFKRGDRVVRSVSTCTPLSMGCRDGRLQVSKRRDVFIFVNTKKRIWCNGKNDDD